MKVNQVFANAKWIIVCKIVQSLIQLIVGMLSARYLGPSNYGLLNYAASLVAFAVPFVKLGFDSTLVKELVESPDKEGEIMGTALVLNICSSIVCMIGVCVFASIVNSGDRESIIVCVLYSISMVFSALEMIQYWFQYRLLSKYSSIAMLVAYVAVSFYKIYLLITSCSVFWFALSNSLDYGIIAISLLWIYKKKSDCALCWSKNWARKLFQRSKYYILASLMLVVLHNTDHIMLTSLVNKSENGYYSAALTCATVAQFVYVAIVDSFRPLILTSRKESSEKFERHMTALYCIILWLGIAQVVTFIICARPIVMLIYGAEYQPAIAVLRVLMTYFVFSLMGRVRNVWILAEQQQKYLPLINFSGAMFNVALNLYMIPHWGACGAALASTITQFFANFVLSYMIKPLRRNNQLMLRALNPVTFVHVICEAKDIFLERKRK